MPARAASAKPGNAAGLSAVALAKAGGFFQHSPSVFSSPHKQKGIATEVATPLVNLKMKPNTFR